MSQDTCPPIDFVFLQDLSGSYTDDLPILKSQIANVIATVEDIDQNADFAVASFIDKPTGSFAAFGEYVYQTHLSLSSNNASVIAAINSLTTRNGLDEPEAQIEALMQAALRTAELGYRPDTKRIVMLSTDSSFHQAGDFASAGPNNGDTVLDGTPAGTGEDYPELAQVAAALVANDIFPVFSVTAAQKTRYDDLVDSLGTGAVVVLTSNSDNFSDAVRLAIAKACGEVTQEGTELEDELEGTEIEDGIYGLGGDDIIRGLAGDDVVDGGSGDDSLRGGRGADDIRGGSGDDALFGGGGADVLKGGIGVDRMTGGGGDDVFIVNPGDGAETITDFEDGRDIIDLSAFKQFEGQAALDGAASVGANVLLTLPGGASVTLLDFTLADLGLEDVILNPETDPPIAVNDAASTQSGRAILIDAIVNDSDPNGDLIEIVAVGTATDGVAALKPNGTLRYTPDAGFTGTDSFIYTLSDGEATSTATVSVFVAPNLIGGAGDDVLTGTVNADIIRGRGGDDVLNGLAGDDDIDGGDGADIIEGGLGLDVIRGRAGDDLITGGPASAPDGGDDDTIFGGAGHDTLYGGEGGDDISGGKGGDVLYGGVSDDKLYGGAGRDTLYGGVEGDEIFGGGAMDEIYGGSGEDQLRGGKGRDLIDGGTGNDEIYGSGRENSLGEDDDTLTGGLGADTFIFDLSLEENLTDDDVITDFDTAEDRITLDGDVLVMLTDTAEGALIEQVTGGSILVLDVLAEDLRPAIDGLFEI